MESKTTIWNPFFAEPFWISNVRLYVFPGTYSLLPELVSVEVDKPLLTIPAWHWVQFPSPGAPVFPAGEPPV